MSETAFRRAHSYSTPTIASPPVSESMTPTRIDVLAAAGAEVVTVVAVVFVAVAVVPGAVVVTVVPGAVVVTVVPPQPARAKPIAKITARERKIIFFIVKFVSFLRVPFWKRIMAICYKRRHLLSSEHCHQVWDNGYKDFNRNGRKHCFSLYLRMWLKSNILIIAGSEVTGEEAFSLKASFLSE
jgi:hypothetical protein